MTCFPDERLVLIPGIPSGTRRRSLLTVGRDRRSAGAGRGQPGPWVDLPKGAEAGAQS